MAQLSDVGRVREQNEDAVFCDVEQGFVVLADGMGGRNAGGMAAQLAVLGIVKQLKAIDFLTLPPDAIPAMLHISIEVTHQAILEASRSDPALAGMGATLVLGVFVPKAIIIAHLGDSRCYRLRQGALAQLTHDHSLLQEQLDLGMKRESPDFLAYQPFQHILTRAIGAVDIANPEFNRHDTVPGDLYLFCSDGLHGLLDDAEIADIMQANIDDLSAAVMALVAAANGKGGTDNISTILVRIDTPS
jgi:protein phosphatase